MFSKGIDSFLFSKGIDLDIGLCVNGGEYVLARRSFDKTCKLQVCLIGDEIGYQFLLPIEYQTLFISQILVYK